MKNTFLPKKEFFRGRKPAQKYKRLYRNWSPRPGTKFGKKSQKLQKMIISLTFFVFYCKNICFLKKSPQSLEWFTSACPFGACPFRACPLRACPFRACPFGTMGHWDRDMGHWDQGRDLRVFIKKMGGKSVLESYTLFFGKNQVFRNFSFENGLKHYLERQISSR